VAARERYALGFSLEAGLGRLILQIGGTPSMRTRRSDQLMETRVRAHLIAVWSELMWGGQKLGAPGIVVSMKRKRFHSVELGRLRKQIEALEAAPCPCSRSARPPFFQCRPPTTLIGLKTSAMSRFGAGARLIGEPVY
jgi:hypothetical protein